MVIGYAHCLTVRCNGIRCRMYVFGRVSVFINGSFFGLISTPFLGGTSDA